MNKSLVPTLLIAALFCVSGAARAQSNAAATSAIPVASPLAVAASSPAVSTRPAAAASDAGEQGLLDRKTQKIEFMHFEDAGNRVDEVRSGGQTQRITVQPKDGAPAYEVLPTGPSTTSPDRGIGQTGPRVWSIHQF
jgi:hypothetical protein